VNKLFGIPEELRGGAAGRHAGRGHCAADDRTVLSYLVSPLAEAWHKIAA